MPGTEVAENLLGHPRVINHGDDPHGALADGAAERVQSGQVFGFSLTDFHFHSVVALVRPAGEGCCQAGADRRGRGGRREGGGEPGDADVVMGWR